MSQAQRTPELLVVDGTAQLFRAYYGGGDRMAPDGTPVGGVMGVVQRLARLLRFERPKRVVAVFDAGQRTFRNDMDERYKANRGAPPPDLVPQFPLCREAVAALGLSTWCVPGFEADDLMATLARMATELGWRSRLLSVDKDLLQLVRDGDAPVVQEDPRSGQVYDEAGVFARLGVWPRQVVDYMALVGDSSDNVPGVKGVGPKTAAALIAEFGDLDGVFAGLDRVAQLKIRGAKTLGARLNAGRAEADLARRLVRLRADVDLELPSGGLAEAACWSGPAQNVDRFFGRLGLRGPGASLRTLAQEIASPPDQGRWQQR